MKTQWTFILMGVILAIIGCDCEDDNNPCADSEIISIISTITHGMNPIEDSLTLVPGNISYSHSCLTPNPVHKNLTCSEWSELSASIDLAKFNALKLNSCARCVDGADMSISVKTASSYHRIMIPYYLIDEGQVPDEIQELYELIERIRADFPLDCNN